MSPLLSRIGGGRSGFGFGSNKKIITTSGSSPVPILMGTLPDDGYAERYISPSPSHKTSNVVYAIGYTNGGSCTVYKSSNGGATWSTGATVTGAGSFYAGAVLAISDTTVIVQHRGDFFRSTNSGASFTTILQTTGGQNNFFNLSWDGTYGMCGGYSQHVYTNDSWTTATASANTLGISMATAPLTNNGNVFLKAGLGSSGSPLAAYHTNNTMSSYSQVLTTLGNQHYAASDVGTGVNIVMGAGYSTLYYATYPGTSYSSTTASGNGNGFPCVTKNGVIIYPSSAGLYKFSGGVHTQLDSLTTVYDSQPYNYSFDGGIIYVDNSTRNIYQITGP